jgi:hypothetical protein
VLMPIIAGKVLGGGPHTLGWLMASAGLGALCGALYLASRQSVVGLERVISTVRSGTASRSSLSRSPGRSGCRCRWCSWSVSS